MDFMEYIIRRAIVEVFEKFYRVLDRDISLVVVLLDFWLYLPFPFHNTLNHIYIENK